MKKKIERRLMSSPVLKSLLERNDGMRYCRNHSLYGEMPKSIPAGRVLAHNKFAHNNGFRC
jgi:hypothetical protein